MQKCFGRISGFGRKIKGFVQMPSASLTSSPLNIKMPNVNFIKMNNNSFSTVKTEYKEVVLESLEDFETEVQQSKQPVVLDFYAEFKLQ